MKTLIKRLFGITKLENELIGANAEIEAQRDALWRYKWLMDQQLALTAIIKAEREGLRESLVNMTKAKPGPWKLTKDKTKRYRRWEYPHAKSMWMTESEPIEQVIPFDWSDDEIKEPDSYLEDRACRGSRHEEPLDGQLYGTDTVVTCDDWEHLPV
jgi:hypothetical protein